MRLILIRGLPGSGKTTMAKAMHGFKHFEADMFFTDQHGRYSWDAAKIKDAHAWCQQETHAALKRGENVVVSNTFTRLFEMAPCIEMGKEFEIEAEIIESAGNFKNVHGVPDEIIEKMRSRWEKV